MLLKVRFGMKRFFALMSVAFGLLLAPNVLFAREVSSEEAARAAEIWAMQNQSLAGGSGVALTPIAKQDASGNTLYYMVPLEGKGVVVVSSDTNIDPVIAVLPDATSAMLPAGHPLAVLLNRDLEQRHALLVDGIVPKMGTRIANDALKTFKDEANATWSQLLEPQKMGLKASVSASKVVRRVDPDGVLQHWVQGAPYNALCPEYTAGARSAVGCVAIAGAMMLQHFEVPGGIDAEKTYTVLGVPQSSRTTGVTYNWDVPTIEMRAQVAYDVGICSNMDYGPESGSNSMYLQSALEHDFGFKTSSCFTAYDRDAPRTFTEAEVEAYIYGQLRGGAPVVLGLTDPIGGGHEVVAMGYAEMATGTPCVEIYCGWGGYGDAWYAIPVRLADGSTSGTIDPNGTGYDFSLLDEVITQIAYADDHCVAIYGQVKDAFGNGIMNKRVTVRGPEGNVIGQIATGTYGHYGLRVSASYAYCTVTVDENERMVDLRATTFPTAVDFVAINDTDVDIVPVMPEGWDATLLVTTEKDAILSGSSFATEDDVYVNFALTNVGTSKVSPFDIAVYVDGEVVDIISFETLPAKDVPVIVSGVALGKLPEGEHTIAVMVDSNDVILELDEENNRVEAVIRVDSTGHGIDLAFDQKGWDDYIVFSKGTDLYTSVDAFTANDTIYADVAFRNRGTLPAAAFECNLYIDGRFVRKYKSEGLAVGAPMEWRDIPVGKLSIGTHTVTVTLDATDALAESNEGNNAMTREITVVSTPAPTKTSFTYMLVRGEVAITGLQDPMFAGSLTIPEEINGRPVTMIAEKAFTKCTSLVSLTIPSCVTNIHPYAFDETDWLQFVVDEANPNYSSLDGALLSKDRTILLHGPGGVMDYTVPAMVTTIGMAAFYGNDYIRTLEIPVTVQTIQPYAFYKTNRLQFIVDEANPNYASLEGALVSKDQTVLLRAPGRYTTYTIPTVVTTIGIAAFYGNDYIQTVTIPGHVREIESYAFECCSALTLVEFLGLPPVLLDGENAFVETEGAYLRTYQDEWEAVLAADGTWNDLTMSCAESFTYAFEGGGITVTGYKIVPPAALVLPSFVTIDGFDYQITRIASEAFKDQTTITSLVLPDLLFEIGEYAFSGCTNLKHVTFPEWLMAIREHAFSNTAISDLIVLPESLTELEYAAFFKCPNLPGATLRNCTQLTAIGDAAFRECANFTAISLPDSLETIGARAFYLNAKLNRVTIASNASKIATIGDYAFSGCAALPTFDFAKTKALKSIKQHAFSNSGLTTFTLPATVTAVEYAAFYRCKKLATATLSSATSLTALGEAAFRECPIFTATSLPRSLKTIGARAFMACPKLVRVTINKENSQLVTIGDEAFMNCSSLTNFTFPNKLQTIQKKAFYASGLNKLYTMPATLTTLASYAFAKCPNLPSMTLKTCTKLTRIGDESFSQCPKFTAISLPDSLTTICPKAFYQNTKLNRVTISDKSKIAIIGANAFYGCKALKTFDFAKTKVLMNIRPYAFAGSALSGSITLPASLQTLEKAAFYRCLNLGTVTLSGCGKLVALGEAAFRECTSLTAISLPRSLKTIEARAFYGCAKLNRVTIHATLANLTTIGDSAFYNCKALKTFSMPSTVKTVQANAFAGCTTTITLNGPRPTTGTNAFPSTVTVIAKTTAYPQPFTYEVMEGAAMITGLVDADTVGAIEIPERINGKPVTVIACDAFRGCYGLETVTIPATVTAIGDGTFVDCGVDTLIFEGLPPEIVYSDDGYNLGIIADGAVVIRN